MESHRELYHEEIQRLVTFREKLYSKSIRAKDLKEFANDYDELITQARVITQVSDRLQKKLDNANSQILNQNKEITRKNKELQKKVYELVDARVGKKASTIMVSVALVLFFMEQYFLEPIIEDSIPISLNFLHVIVLIVLFFLVKSLEAGLEKYFRKQEHRKILTKK